MTAFSWPKASARAGLAAAGSSGLLRDSMSPGLLLACWAGAGHQAPSCLCGRRAPAQRRQGSPANLLGWNTTAADLLPRAAAPPFGRGLRAPPPPPGPPPAGSAPPGGPDDDAKTRFPAPMNPNIPPSHHQKIPKFPKIRPGVFRG
eukprot:gene8121-biopygen7601